MVKFRQIIIDVFEDDSGHEYSNWFLCLGYEKDGKVYSSPHLIQDDDFHPLDGNDNLGKGICSECLKYRDKVEELK